MTGCLGNYKVDKISDTAKSLHQQRLLCKLERGQSSLEKCRLTILLINRRFPVQLVRMLNPISTRCNIVLGVLKPTDTEA